VSRRRGTQHRKRRQVHRCVDPFDVPEGYVVANFGDGEFLLHAPELIDAMREACPCCRGEHDAEA
jgi:hypothetical protein